MSEEWGDWRHPEYGTRAAADEVREAIAAVRRKVTEAIGDLQPANVLAITRSPGGDPLPLVLDERSWRLVRVALDHTLDAI